MAAMREAFAATATDLLETDDRVAIVLADISETLLTRAIRHDPLRVVNVGIAEQSMVGVAAGFAMEGFHPIAHSLSPFMAERPYEQLKLDFGYQGLGGTFVGSGGSYDYAGEGATHHSPADVSLMLAIPRMQVLVPGHGHSRPIWSSTWDLAPACAVAMWFRSARRRRSGTIPTRRPAFICARKRNGLGRSAN